ncbi:aminodeoxychorismate synthase component I [Cellvibrio japonicus]|uniref:aminodeoxychorismate synthase n=1 Tax=Cellvibrio japonicus (strain Ueda107) TaxID=498211 RepID=B3PHN7_CELJU|nr:aminodeoxychorismate synthase component I [Cellvibrio japonicus]ACE85462.1 para-aminobenzoate synthase, component I [Cellvibrio japonicus Ueda107]QEI12506.1 aminodeoxychorismate synthase component I [Cellvibrio japonicus]QEI16080.1 aminodeoxychorismate synthase component I [Cellvibrio japonicus]QEI19658.1 aminodeoxychorismate synthase component I [Cellvibrio japonicus]
MQSSLVLHPLPYTPDSVSWLLAIRHLPRLVWLDSGHPGSHYGRFDILAAAPSVNLETHGTRTVITHNTTSQSHSLDDPFQLLGQYLSLSSDAVSHPLPFIGGALGYFGYDLGRRLEKLPNQAQADIDLPDLSIGIYPWAILQDHQQQQAWLVFNPALDAAYNFLEIEQLCRDAPQNTWFHEPRLNLKSDNNLFKINEFKSKVNVDEYAKAMAQIQAYIRAGDCYQVNYAQRFSACYQGDPLLAYLALRTSLPSPFSGFMQLPQGAVLSLSPERFIQVRRQQVETKPIKGTIKRGATAEEDVANANWLVNSTKNRAENVMIVDLLRNDLSKHCTRVKVPTLCELQTFANVHHLVSTVTAQLNPNASPLDVLRDSFPGGSITGAPKIRAMEIIEELEPTRRSVYCGSLGYISQDGQMDTNIAIRTLVCDGEQIHCWGGGGIVADSETDQEYTESIAKVKVLMDTLEQYFGPTT